MEDIHDLVNKNIKLNRISKGMTQEQLALAANLHRAYIGHIERGEKKIGLYNLYKISIALNMEISELLKK